MSRMMLVPLFALFVSGCSSSSSQAPAGDAATDVKAEVAPGCPASQPPDDTPCASVPYCTWVDPVTKCNLTSTCSAGSGVGVFTHWDGPCAPDAGVETGDALDAG